MSPCGKIPKSVAQSQLKMCLYESFENHWHTMVWLNRGSRGKADIWWDDTIEWLEHVSLEHVSIEKINPVVAVPVPEHERRTSTVAWPKPSDRYWQSDSIRWKQRIKKHPYHVLSPCLSFLLYVARVVVCLSYPFLLSMLNHVLISSKAEMADKTRNGSYNEKWFI